MLAELVYAAYAILSFYMIYGVVKIIKGDVEEGSKIVVSVLILTALSLGSKSILEYLFPDFYETSGEDIGVGAVISVSPQSGQKPLNVKIVVINVLGGKALVKVLWANEEASIESTSRIISLEHTFPEEGSYLVNVYVTINDQTYSESYVINVYESPVSSSSWGWSWIISQVSKFIGYFIEGIGLHLMSSFPFPSFSEALYFLLFLPTSHDLNSIFEIYWNISFPISLLILSPALIVNALRRIEDEEPVFLWSRDLVVWSILSTMFPYFYEALAVIMNYVTAILVKDVIQPVVDSVSPIYSSILIGLTLSYFFPSLGNLSLLFLFYLLSFYVISVLKYVFTLSMVILAPILFSLRLMLPGNVIDSIMSTFLRLLLIGPISGAAMLTTVYVMGRIVDNSSTLALLMPAIMLLLPFVILRFSGLGFLLVRINQRGRIRFS